MDIFNFLFNNFDNILALVGVGIIIFFALKTGKKEDLFSAILSLMLESEKLYGSETGVGKREDVINKLPSFFKFIYSKKEIKKIIDGFAEEHKSLLDKVSSNLESGV